MMFVKFKGQQNTNDKMVTSITWYGEMAIDRSICSDRFVLLHQWLMSLKSITQKTTSKGSPFQDPLFTGIHRSPDGRDVTFYFYKANEAEATNQVAGLPLVIRDELKLDPGCFFHRSNYLTILEGTWTPATREYKNKGMMNQEQYLQELDEFFSVNRTFLPDMIVFENTVNTQTQADGVSVLSQLTDKMLRAATSIATLDKSSQDDSSIESGQTSRSKTQAAVKEALKEVSLEHNRAMEDQRVKCQRELEELGRSLERNYSPQSNLQEAMSISIGVATTHQSRGAAVTEFRGNEPIVLDVSPPQEASMDIYSSDDEMAMEITNQSSRKTGVSATDNKSPTSKCLKRSTLRTLRGRGGSKSHPGRNDE
jgi:hypothetical protein